MLVNLRDDILNTIPNCHIITVQSMSIMKSISIMIQFDTLVFLNLGNKLFTGAKWQLRNATESGWTMCTSHLFLGFMKIILTDNKCTFRHFQFIMSSIGSRLSQVNKILEQIKSFFYIGWIILVRYNIFKIFCIFFCMLWKFTILIHFIYLSLCYRYETISSSWILR